MEQKSTFWKSAMIYGLYFGIAITFYSVILYVLGQSQNKTLGYITFLFYAVGIVIAQIYYRDKEMDGAITYGQTVGIGVAVMLFVGIITALYTMIIYNIDPGLIDQIKAMQEEAMLKQGLSDDQIEASMAITSKMMSPGWMSISGLFGSVIIGTIISLVSAIFIKKQPSEDAFEDAMEEVKKEE